MNKSTHDAIAQLVEHISEALDESSTSLAVFIDLAKAFDTVNHEILLGIMQDMGIRGIPYKLFQSYLIGRKQMVRVGDKLSEDVIVTCGVPHGTVLGPQLFIIYLNGLLDLNVSGKIISFADDTVIFYRSNDWYELKGTVENDMRRVKKWLDSHLLSVNVGKTVYLPFRCYGDSLPTCHLDCGKDFKIPMVNTVKYLGIVLDCHMRWNLHVDFLIKKLRSILYKYKYLAKFLSFHHRKILYHSLVEPHLMYGILSWGRLGTTYLKKLEVTQKRFLRILTSNDYRCPTDRLFSESCVYDLRQIFYFQVCIKQYSSQENLLLPAHSYSTRMKHRYIHPLVKKTLGQRSLRYLGPKALNSLPCSVTSAYNLRIFKGLLTKFMNVKSRADIEKILFD